MRKIFLFTLVMMLFLAACGGSKTETDTTEAETTTEETAVDEPTAEPTAEPAPAEETAAEPATSDIAATITIESWRNDDLAIWQDVIIPAFNAEHPEIEVIFAPSAPAEYNGVLNTKLAGGTAGDLITCRPFDASLELFDAGYLASLNDLDGMDNFGDVAKSAWVTDDGSDVFCVPMASVIHGFIYNQDLFAEAGVEPPETVDEFFAVMDALDAAGITPLDMGTADQWEAATMGFQNVGPNYWNGEDGRLALISGEGKLTDQAYVDTLAQLARWGDYLPSGFEAQTYPDSQNLFTLGQAAIYPAGSWDISLFNDQADFELGAFMPPVQAAGDPCYISDHTDIALGMNANTENPEAVKTFLTWVASAEFANLYSNALPGFFSLSNADISIDDPIAQEFVNWRGECDSTIRNSYQILSRGEPNLENELWRVSAQVINGDITPEEGAQQLQDGLDMWYTPNAADAATAEDAVADEAEETADAGGYEYLAAAMAGDYEGEEVTVFGKWTEAEGDNFEVVLAEFAEATGIDILYEGSSEFETLITVRTEGGDAPDIAGFPQPALMAEFVRTGDVIDYGAYTNVDQLNADFSEAWTGLATVDGQLSAVPYRASTKSIVWYPTAAFEEAGYEAPQTWDELIALSDDIVANQEGNPWCVSIEHGGVTGWVATDWVEDVLLRTAPPETYDAWVSHDIPFNDPAVLNAVDIVGDLWFADEYVYGGSTGILSIFVGDTQTPMFEDPPQCWFHKQAGWIPDFWPEGTEPGVDSSFFYLPGIDPAYGSPVLGAGDFFAAFDDRPEVLAVMEFLASPEGAETWIKSGGFISPSSAVPSDWYGDYSGQAQAEILATATTLRFDASDLMPAEVGAGTFWSGMVDWVSAEGTNTEEVFQSIEDSWPTE